MDSWQDILAAVRKPGRYTGGEHNAVVKTASGLAGRCVLAYPDLYELGMSYLGLQVLYDLVNRQPDLGAERVFAPDLDLETRLRELHRPLASLESGTPLAEFDLVGFSLQHELNLPDVLVMLELGGIPLRAAERDERQPVVIAGGPCATNPEPLADALDAVVLGDGEPVLVDLLRLVARMRRARAPRSEVLETLATLPGVYVPSLYRPHYRADGHLASMTAIAPAPDVVERSLLSDLADHPPPSRPVVPGIQTIHDRLAVEIQRGCTRGCRFCQAGMINRPVRQREQRDLLQSIATGLRHTGHEQVSFLSLSAGDHPQILTLLEAFFGQHAPERISASLPSLRAETLSPGLAELVKTVRKSGFTIAPEAGSERLRRVINKNLTDADVLAAARGAFDAGWRQIKLYFMVGLPTETTADRVDIVGLTRRVHQALRQAGHRPQIHVGLSTFVPKAHTPFQWEAMLDRDRASEVNRQVRDGLRGIGGVKVSWTPPDLSWAEGVLSRGDRRLFESLLSFVRAGSRLAGWSEHFAPAAFEQALEQLPSPLNAEHYLGSRPMDAPTAWQHLHLGPSTEFLRDERKRAQDEACTVDCARDACSNCGACPPGVTPQVVTGSTPAATAAPDRPVAPCETANTRVRLLLAKRDQAVYLSHLEFMTTVLRALRRAEWPLVYSGGFHPKPKVSAGPACPVGVFSEAEYLEVVLARETDMAMIEKRLTAELPAGLQLLGCTRLEPEEPGIASLVTGLRYRIRLPDSGDLVQVQRTAEELMRRADWIVERQVKGKLKSVDLRPSLLTLHIERPESGPWLMLDLDLAPSSVARPAEVAAVFGLDHPRVERLQLILRPVDKPASGGQT